MRIEPGLTAGIGMKPSTATVHGHLQQGIADHNPCTPWLSRLQWSCEVSKHPLKDQLIPNRTMARAP